MEFISGAAIDALESGLAYMIAFLGVWLAFRVQRAFDLTVGGSFAAGGAISAIMISNGSDPWLALLVSSIAAGVAGMVTFCLHRFLGLSVILASIISNTAMLSVNLVILGSPTISILQSTSIFDMVAEWTGAGVRSPWLPIIVLSIVGLIVLASVNFFLNSQRGLAFRMSGINPEMSKSLGVSPTWMLFLALVVANALAGLSGSLVTQNQGYADLHMGDTILIVGLTGILLGELVVRRGLTVPIWGIVAVVIGSYLYRLLIALAFRFGIAPQLFSGLTAAIIVAALILNQIATGASAGWLPSRKGRLSGAKVSDALKQGEMR